MAKASGVVARTEHRGYNYFLIENTLLMHTHKCNEPLPRQYDQRWCHRI